MSKFSNHNSIFTLLNNNNDEDLLALVLNGDHDHVGLVDQVGGRGEHDRRLTLLEIFLQCIRELFAIFHKFSFPLLQSMFALKSKVINNYLHFDPKPELLECKQRLH